MAGSPSVDVSFHFRGVRAARLILIVDQDEFPCLDAEQIFEEVKEEIMQNINFACDITAQPEEMH